MFSANKLLPKIKTHPKRTHKILQSIYLDLGWTQDKYRMSPKNISIFLEVIVEWEYFPG